MLLQSGLVRFTLLSSRLLHLQSFSFPGLVLRHYDEHFGRPEQIDELSKQFLFETPLAPFSADVDVFAQRNDVVGVRQLLDHDAERAVFRPHSQELGDDQHQGHIETDDSTTAKTASTSAGTPSQLRSSLVFHST